MVTAATNVRARARLEKGIWFGLKVFEPDFIKAAGKMDFELNLKVFRWEFSFVGWDFLAQSFAGSWISFGLAVISCLPNSLPVKVLGYLPTELCG